MKALIVTLLFLAPLAQAQESTRVFYEVPVQKELQPYAKYEVNYFGKKVSGNNLELSYQLPLDLTGIPQDVKFTGKIVNGKEPSVLTGERGVMNCGVRGNILDLQACAVKYHGIDVSLDEVAKRLDLRRVGPEAKSGMLQVAAMFRDSGGDIGGIITYVYDSH